MLLASITVWPSTVDMGEARKPCILNLIIMVVKVLKLELGWAIVSPDKLPYVLVLRSLFWRILHAPGH
jgi:hypothetical protein